MLRAELEKLLEPVSPESPCGPDLDMEGDDEFMNRLAGAEGMFPAQYFDHNVAEFKTFTRGGADFDSEIAALGALLQRSRDVRPLVAMAKFYILDRKLSEFIDVVDVLARLLTTRWDDVNPKPEDGDFTFRNVAIQSLEDWSHVLYPLKYSEILRHNRYGTLTWRGKEILDGAEPRQGEPTPNPAQSRDLLEKCDLDVLVARRDDLERLSGALDAIAGLARERIEDDPADLKTLRELARSMSTFLDEAVGARDPLRTLRKNASDEPTEGEGVEGEEPGPALGGLGSVAAAAAALAAAGDYFQRSEPSNPALLLIRQAEQLVGRTFSEVMQILLPDHFDSAAFDIGRRQSFQVPVHRIAADGIGIDAGQDLGPAPTASDRKGALGLLIQVENFYNSHEPTSPIPFFCERARRVAGQDFLSLLNEILPPHTLKSFDV